MHKRLIEIIEVKKQEVTRLKKERLVNYNDGLAQTRDFKRAVSAPGGIGLIAEIKFASPSVGLIREKSDPCTIGLLYEEAGAAAISLLTDRQFFGGDLDQLPGLKSAVSLPILRKDFIIDEIQVREAFQYGADAVLLIARILSQHQLKDYIDLCRTLGMAALTEVHDRDDLEKAVESGAEIIGINNRDLDSFKVDIGATFELAPLVPDNCVLISESGIENPGHVRSLKGAGIHAVLVGSSLMRSPDPGKKAGELVKAGKGSGHIEKRVAQSV